MRHGRLHKHPTFGAESQWPTTSPEWLAEVRDPENAAESLEEMGRLLRSALGSAPEEG